MKILAGVDSSDHAFKALSKAIEMAKAQGAELTVMSVAWELPEVMEIPMGTADKLMDHAARAVTRAKQLAEEAGVNCQTRVEVSGSPADNIVRYAADSKTDVIVLGHRGLSALDRFVVGSVAARVVAYAPCSVFVVR